jgi:hypothetical protein
MPEMRASEWVILENPKSALISNLLKNESGWLGRSLKNLKTSPDSIVDSVV